jgi:glycerol-3-phosphate cytidylyltransferase
MALSLPEESVHQDVSPDTREGRGEAVRVITFGTFDLFHIGHLNILKRAKSLGDYLVVGVSSDELTWRKKGVRPVFPLVERLALVAGTRYVDEVFVEESLEQKGLYIRRYRADTLVMGNDWAGKFDQFASLCEVVYLPRTPVISSSDIRSQLRQAS